MNTSIAKNRFNAARALAALLALASLSTMLGSCEDPLTAVAAENVRLATFNLTTLAVTGPGSISFPSTSTVSIRYNVPYTINAGDPTSRGYYFSGWSKTGGTGTAVFGNALAKSTTVTVSGGDVTITATFSPISATLTRRGSLLLDDTAGYTEQRLDDINDLIYEAGYIYAVGSFSGTAKILKIDVSTPTNPSFDSSHEIVSSSIANEIIKEGSYFYIGVSGTGGDRYRTTIKTGSGFNSFTDMGHNVSVKQLTGDGWVTNSSDDISRYQVPGSFDGNSDTPLADILYIPGFNYLYVTREAGMGSDGSAEVYYSSGGIMQKTITAVVNKSPGKMVYNGGYYIYSASGIYGIITLNVNSAIFNYQTSIAATTSTGQPNDVDITGNYLVSTGTSTTDRIAIYDIHADNGCISNPYYLGGINRFAEDVTALDAEGSYVYTIEGKYLVIYQITTSTP